MISGNRPEVVTNPDPTTAVKEALELAIKNLSHEMDLRFEAIKDTAIAAASANRELVSQLATANATALNAALQTSNDLIKQLQISFETANKATNEKIDRLTSRLDLGQGGFINSNDLRRDHREDARDTTKQGVDNRALIIAIVGVVVAAAVFVFGAGLHK